MGVYDIGDVVVLRAEFAVNGTPTNPTTVTCQLRAPSGAITTVATTNPSTGVYTAEIEPNAPGGWTYRFAGTGAAKAAGEQTFEVQRSVFS